MKVSKNQWGAMHLWFKWCAEELNRVGISYAEFFNPDFEIPWTPVLCESVFWRPVEGRGILKRDAIVQAINIHFGIGWKPRTKNKDPFLEELAEFLNSHTTGYRDFSKVKKHIQWWDAKLFKESGWKYVMRLATGKTSTLELDSKEVGFLQEVISRRLGEKSINVEWPHRIT